ncbi:MULTISPECIES: PTS sugar transporter subunit IIA [Clostridium]|uniref:PTS sugar transporter subunit IIA n=1 Tax=Clostridium TaxID=1485 RepID=UPI0002E3023F|nr:MULTISPECIES: PTS sugar transporter subunit IIA [Clostridium]AVK49270.1 PTS fructose transporter subunit IIA [Clostridium sp. MF28]MBE6087601.1 PTS sugar transporter subunit IIA [Clostridium beijerinckii]NOW88510.1 PTS system galactitol-specific IIA component [Clostridium beijerinckii]NRT78256.1 PTS system galactitol-specific IIA component [Clostridium beijerinckii]OOM48962.1 PTS system fructose-specific EIIABC component [Clostridium beijerinckii]
MELVKFINEKLIKVNLPCKDRNELFKMMHDEAFKYGYVESSFLDGLISRESIFPTGIKLNNYSVAIPHTDAVHVKKEFIAIVVPENPIQFKLMEDEKQEEKVNLVFMLGLNKPHSQLEVLRELMDLIQREDLVKQIIRATSQEDIENILNKLQSV